MEHGTTWWEADLEGEQADGVNGAFAMALGCFGLR